MISYTADDLLRGVKRLVFLPDTTDLTDSDLLELADEEQVTLISDFVQAERGEFFVTYEDVALLPSQRVYPIPTRAMGRVLRGVSLLNSSGISFPSPTLDPVHGWDGNSPNTPTYAHSVVGDTITFPSLPPNATTMRVWYMRRPSRLTLTSAALPILHWVSPTALEVNAYPPDVFTFTTPFNVDVVRGSAPFEPSYTNLIAADWDVDSPYQLLLDGSTPVEASSFVNLTTVANARQDYVCMAETTVYPQIPQEFFPVLEAAVARRALEAIGDREGAAAVDATLTTRRRAAIDITSPRDQEGSRSYVRRSSSLRTNVGRSRRGSFLR